MPHSSRIRDLARPVQAAGRLRSFVQLNPPTPQEVTVRRITLAAIGAAFLCVAPNAAVAQEAPEWAQEQLAAWYEAFNVGDATSVGKLYAPDATVLPPQGEASVGRSAIVAGLEGLFSEMSFTCEGGYDGFQVRGDLAAGWGHDSCVMTSKSGGEALNIKSRWLAFYQRQPDGDWLLLRDTWEEEDLTPVNEQ